MVQDADLRTLYLHQPRGRCGPGGVVREADDPAWRQCRVLEVSELLRALVREMPSEPDGAGTPPTPDALRRERHLSALICDELRSAAALRLGVDLPRDKRLCTCARPCWRTPRAMRRWKTGRATPAPARAPWRGFSGRNWAAPSRSGASR